MNQAELRTPQDFSKAALAFSPVASNSAQNGASIDRTGYRSAIADVAFSCSGSPTGGLLTLKWQDSADGTTFADFGAAVTAAIPASGGAIASIPVHLGGARKYIRLVSQGAPTGGTSPVVSAAATLRLYGPDNLPAA